MTSITQDGRTEFRFYRPGAIDVKVVGTFNKWDATAMQMQDQGDGWFVAEADVEPGEHLFRYVADGHWFTDFAANGVERNKYGWNSILIVPARRMRIGLDVTREDDQRQREALAA